VVGPPFVPLIRWLLVNAAALILCGFVLSGVRIDGSSDYLLGALGMEIPTLVWILTASRWNLDKSSL
jgi:F0F1-type ATP synthase assembly protein I